jgi:MYXO-CTERM domain-containing protein
LQFSSATCSGTNLSCDVQSWIDSGNAFGWLIASSGTSPGQAQKFYSKEAGTTPPTLAFTFACKAGFKDLGSSCTTCTDAANAACVTTHVGNSCNDSGPPSTTYSCNCDLSVYRSSGTPACVIGCSPVNHCRDNGDASAACTDTASGYSCTCDPGYVLNATGTSCVDACPSTPDPCGNGTCTAGGTGWTCGCNPGYVSSGGTFAHCNDYNACNAAALADCTTHPGDACVDEAAPSMTYHCTCGNPADKVGTGADGGPACVDIDDCNPNHCVDGGDTGATCTDPGGTTLGYSCTCTSALWEQGLLGTDVTCVDVDECATGNPCGNGVCTNVGSGGGYTCACATGYVSSGGMQPTCANLDACDSAAIAACTTQPGNACVDDAPPSTGYHCTCGNPAYAAGTVAGQPACVDNNECMPNHCQDGGDSTATCADHAAPATGYDCTCDAGWSSDGTTCRDVDECAQDHLCDHGTCSNVPGSYECTCDKGYESTTDTAPVCVPVADKAGGCGCASQGGGAQALLLVLIVALARPRRRRRSRR